MKTIELQLSKSYLIGNDTTVWHYVGLDDEDGSIGCYHLFLDDAGNQKRVYYDSSELSQIKLIKK